MKELCALESRLHANDGAPPVEEWNSNVAEVWFVSPGGVASKTTAAAATPGRAAHEAIAMSSASMTILAIVVAGPTPVRITAAYSVAFAALAVQLVAVRPRLTQRSDQVLAGRGAPRSRGHYAYIGLEAVKVIALVVAGILLLVG